MDGPGVRPGTDPGLSPGYGTQIGATLAAEPMQMPLPVEGARTMSTLTKDGTEIYYRAA